MKPMILQWIERQRKQCCCCCDCKQEEKPKRFRVDDSRYHGLCVTDLSTGAHVAIRVPTREAAERIASIYEETTP